MDYDDNDFQAQNLHLAGEGSSKFSPVLPHYALPKFDFDDSLQGHLRFDSLVENEVFLGIPSQEDNQWIEDFSRGSSGIEFSSSAAESCSISRRNNVWSEATSSESVEMLLKSVGQEVIVLGETIIEESDACQELGSLTEQMEPHTKQDDKIKDVIDSDPSLPVLPSDELLEQFSSLNGVEGASKPKGTEVSIHGSSHGVDPNASSETRGIPATEINPAVDGKCDNENQIEFGNSRVKSLDSRLQKDSSGSGVEIDIIDSSSQDIGARVEVLNNQEPDNLISNVSFENKDSLLTETGNAVGEHHALGKEVDPDDQILEGIAFETGSHDMENISCSTLKAEPIGQRTVETGISTFEEPSSLPSKEDGDLQRAEGCSEDIPSGDPGKDSKHEPVDLPDRTEMHQQFKENMHEDLPVVCKGDSKLEGHASDVSNIKAGISSSSELKDDQTYVENSSDVGKDCSRGSDHQLDTEASVSNSDASLLPGVDKNVIDSQGDMSGSKYVGDHSSLIIACSLTEPCGYKPTIEILESVDNASEPSTQVNGMQVNNVVVDGLNCNPTARNEPDLSVSLENTNLASLGRPNEKEVTDYLGNNKKTEGEGSMEANLLLSKESSEKENKLGPVLGPDICAPPNSALELSIVDVDQSLSGAGASNLASGSEQAVESLHSAVGQSLPMTETSGIASQSGHVVKDIEISENPSNKLEFRPTLCDSTIKQDVGAEVPVVPGNHVESHVRKDQEASAKVADALSAAKRGEVRAESSSIPLSESNCNIDENNRKVSDKPNSTTPTVISCNVLSQSEKEKKAGVKESMAMSIPLSEVTFLSTTSNVSRSNAAIDDGSFRFRVHSSVGLSEKETSKDWPPFPAIHAHKKSTVVEGSPSTPGVSQVDTKMVPELSHGSSQTLDANIACGTSKGTTERKTRQASGKAKPSGKSTIKGSAKKGSRVKETATQKPSEKGHKSSNVSMSFSGMNHLVSLDGLKPYGNVERSGIIPCVVSVPSSSLPDLNTSAPLSALFQQPFTDLQQVQLRAQIFVYGSLIQGGAPDEACMFSAFGASDGGRSVWEPLWRACVERLQGQKSHPNTSESPVQPLSGARPPDQSRKQGALQTKVLPLPVSQANSKGTPPPVFNSMISLSSPLWNIPTPSCDGLQSSGLLKSSLSDYHQKLSRLHPFQTPPTRSFIGHNTSWLSQSPFSGPWVASPLTSTVDASAHLSMSPMAETVKLTPVKESSVPVSSGIKHLPPSTVVHSTDLGVFAGTSSLPDMKKFAVSSSQNSSDSKARKRKKVTVCENLAQVSLLTQTRTQSVSAPVATSHLSTSIVVSTPACFASKGDATNIITIVSPISSTDHPKKGEHNAEQNATLSEDTSNKVEEAKRQAEVALALAAAAGSHSQSVWSQLDKQKNSELIADVEAKLSSAAAAVAAAASVAKAAAAAAEVASNAALQAKLMADEAMISSGTSNPAQNNATSLSDVVNSFGEATPASILKGGVGSSSSRSFLVAAKEAAGRRVEAASAASKQAENLDAIVKAAELAAEAVSQAGKIVAMGDPLPLNSLAKAGPDGYWRVPQVPSEDVMLNIIDIERPKVDGNEGLNVSDVHAKGPKEVKTLHGGLSHLSREITRESSEDRTGAVGGISSSFASSEKDSVQRNRRAPELSKTIGVVPESEIGLRSASVAAQDEHEKGGGSLKGNIIKEGSLVEVNKDGDEFKAAWFSANVLSLMDGKAFVCYTELQSDDGSGKLKEWVALEGEVNSPPRIRAARPTTNTRFEGTRKRRRAAMGDYVWSVGDRVDVWIQDCWREGVVTEKNKKDDTALTVRFPAEGQTSVVRTWNLRPTLVWKDGEWIEWSSSTERDPSSQGDTPQEKRLKLGSSATEGRDKANISKTIEQVESGKQEESRLLPLSADDKIFDVGKNARNVNKPSALRAGRTGLQKEGSRVIFGVPKPGKKRKLMEVSKHYVVESSSKTNESNDSVKFAKYLMPQGSGSRGWKNTKTEAKEKQAAVSKTKVLKSGKPQSVSGRTLPRKDKFLISAPSAQKEGAATDHVIKDSVSTDENESGKQNTLEFRSVSNTEQTAEGPVLFSSLALPSDVTLKKMSTSDAISERMNEGKLATSKEKVAKIELKDKTNYGNSVKSFPEVVEPRRSNRRIQPTSRMLEGLQSSLIISKIPVVSHDKSHRSQIKGTSKGNNHG